MHIIQTNRIVAEFMGAKFNIDGTTQDDGYPKIPDGYEVWGNEIDSFLKYSTDWNWLMPVVEKIESLGDEEDAYVVFIEGVCCNIASDGGTVASADREGSKRLTVYKAVVEFIQWFKQPD